MDKDQLLLEAAYSQIKTANPHYIQVNIALQDYGVSDVTDRVQGPLEKLIKATAQPGEEVMTGLKDGIGYVDFGEGLIAYIPVTSPLATIAVKLGHDIPVSDEEWSNWTNFWEQV